MPPRSPDDAELIARLQRGDERTFAELVGRLSPSMLRLGRQLLGDAAAAEELLQETWAAALDALGDFEARSSLKTWLFKIYLNRCKTRRQRDARQVPFSALDREGDENAPSVDPSRFAADGHWSRPPHAFDDDTPERIALRAEARARIEEALAMLPEAQRAVVTMRDLFGWESGEVCSVLEISEANQRVLLHRGRSRLRAALEDYLQRGGAC